MHSPEFINIYELIDPRDNQPRYIGYTKLSPEKRLKGHFKARSNKHKINWLKLLKSQRLEPIPLLIEKVPNGQHKFWEKYWISQYRTWGFDLLNATEGGDGVEDHTGEIARRIGDAQRGVPNKPSSPETRKKISDSLKGKKKSPESIAKRLETERQNRLKNPEKYIQLDLNRIAQLNKKPHGERNFGDRVGYNSKPIIAIMPDSTIVSYYDNAVHVKESIPSLFKYSRVHITATARNNGDIQGIKLSYL